MRLGQAADHETFDFATGPEVRDGLRD